MPRAARSTIGRFSDIKSEYGAMTDNRFRRKRAGVGSNGLTGDAHALSEARFIKMREYVRAMDRDDWCIGQVTDRAVENQVQGGAQLEVSTGDKALDADLWADFNAWATDPRECDAAGLHPFAEMERLVGRAEYIDGDVLALPIDDGSLQLVEAHRLRTPTNTSKNIVHGVELDSRRRRIRYYFAPDNIDPLQQFRRVGDAVKIDAFDEDGEPNVFHVFKPHRLSLTRGLTRFKAIFDIATMTEDTVFAVSVKQQMAACAVWNWEKDRNAMAGGPMATGEQYERQLADFTTAIEQGLSPGQMFDAPPGYKLAVSSPNVPGDNYFPHMKLLLTIIGIQIGTPLFLVLLDPSESNFSAWRGAWDQTKIGYRYEQRRRIAQFNTPVYRWRVRRRMASDPAVANAAKRQGIDIFGHEWNPPDWPYIQPLHDAQANALRLQTGQVSLRRFHAEIGSDFETFATENVADIELWMGKAADAYTRFVQKFPDLKQQVTVYDFYYRDFFRGGQLIDTADTPNNSKQPAPAKS
jgi:capsid protein